MMERCTIVGVDCATDPKNVGLARGMWEKGKLRITDVTDFLAGKAYPPSDLALAQKEGWIWIRP